MRTITKDIQLTIDGSPQGFRLTKPDAFSGVEILRLLLRLQDQASCHPEPQAKDLSVSSRPRPKAAWRDPWLFSPCHPEPQAKDLNN